jgi:hypothetical protein
MKLIKKIGCLVILLSFVAQKTYTMETPDNNPGWLGYAKETILNGYSGLKQFLSNVTTTDDSVPFGQLPTETQTEIIKLLAASCTDKTLTESAQTINALAKTNKHLNNLINDPEFNLQLIKNRAKQFNVSDMKVAKILHTKSSQVQLLIQLYLARTIKNIDEEQESGGVVPKLNKILKKLEFEGKVYKADLDFTYRWNQESQEYASPLMYAVLNDNKFLIQYLLKNGANINQASFNGKTPLMYASDADTITFLAKQPGLNINQQDTSGNTALLRAIQHYFPEDEDNKEQNIGVIQTLLDNDANPTIANNNGDTPLKAAQATGDQEVIDLIQQAIDNHVDLYSNSTFF